MGNKRLVRIQGIVDTERSFGFKTKWGTIFFSKNPEYSEHTAWRLAQALPHKKDLFAGARIDAEELIGCYARVTEEEVWHAGAVATVLDPGW